jgi:hypothetical protein
VTNFCCYSWKLLYAAILCGFPSWSSFSKQRNLVFKHQGYLVSSTSEGYNFWAFPSLNLLRSRPSLEAWVGQITCCKIQDSTSLWQILLVSLLVFLCDIAVTKCVDISWISVMFFYFCIMIWSQIGPVLSADSDNSLTSFFWNGFLHNGLFTVKGWRDNVMHV